MCRFSIPTSVFLLFVRALVNLLAMIMIGIAFHLAKVCLVRLFLGNNSVTFDYRDVSELALLGTLVETRIFFLKTNSKLG